MELLFIYLFQDNDNVNEKHLFGENNMQCYLWVYNAR